MKKETDPFYSSTAWKKLRHAALVRDGGACVLCKRAGRVSYDSAGRCVPVRATMVHHKKPIKEAPELALDINNLVSLCDSCHDSMHPEKFGHKEKAPPVAVLLGIKVEKIETG